MSKEGGRKEFIGSIGAGENMKSVYVESGKREPKEPEHEMNVTELRDKLIEALDIKEAEAKVLREDSYYWNDTDKEAVEMAINGSYNAGTYEKWKKESNREPLRDILYRAFKEYQ